MKIFLISSIINRLITVTVLFLLPLFFIAQTTSFVSLGTEQGLVQSQVQSLTQDDQGNLWIGTIAGITKYNGTSFDNYTKKMVLQRIGLLLLIKIKKEIYGLATGLEIFLDGIKKRIYLKT